MLNITQDDSSNHNCVIAFKPDKAKTWIPVDILKGKSGTYYLVPYNQYHSHIKKDLVTYEASTQYSPKRDKLLHPVRTSIKSIEPFGELEEEEQRLIDTITGMSFQQAYRELKLWVSMRNPYQCGRGSSHAWLHYGNSVVFRIFDHTALI